MNIDWKLLKEQKEELLKMIWDDKDSKVWGIIHLLDELQDKFEVTLEDLIRDTLSRFPNESYSKTADRILEKSDAFSHRTLRRKVAKVAKEVKV